MYLKTALTFDFNVQVQSRRLSEKDTKKKAGGGGYSWEFLVGVVPPGPPNPDPISDPKMSFSTPVFLDLTHKIHTRFQTWPLGRNKCYHN